MLAHLFDRFYVVTKFILPSVKYLKFSVFNYDSTCAYFNGENKGTAENKKYILDMITALVSGFIGLAYEGISSFLHNRRHKALHKAVKAMDNKTTIQYNKLVHLENSMVMYGIYCAETLEKPINTVHHIYNITSPYDKLCRIARHRIASTYIH